jgi:hypothetical protein
VHIVHEQVYFPMAARFCFRITGVCGKGSPENKVHMVV